MKRIRVWVQAQAGRRFLRLQWLDPVTGRRRSKSAETADTAVAEDKRQDLEYELNNNLYVDREESIGWDKLTQLYTEEKLAGDSEAHMGKAEHVFRKFKAICNPRQATDVDERMLTRYVSGMRSQGLAASTIRGHLLYLGGLLNWAAEQHMIPRVPKIKPPKATKNSSRKRARTAGRITTEEFERIVKACPNAGWKLLVSFAWHCGMRREEARSVRGRDVDLDEHSIAIPHNKAGDEDATVVIPPALDKTLREAFPDGMPRGRLIQRADVPESLAWISNRFGEIATKARVKGNGKSGQVTLHDLRRAFGSRWAAKVPAQVLKAMMRHANIATTLEFYAETESQVKGIVWPECTTSRTTEKSNKSADATQSTSE